MENKLNRRDFVLSGSALMALLASCGRGSIHSDDTENGSENGTEPLDDRAARIQNVSKTTTTGNGADLTDRAGDDTILMYDTYAMATYFDGTLGPKTGICKVDDIIANTPVTMKFWHGHNGKLHQFTITPEHFKMLRHSKKVVIDTTTVDGHKHKLFIDPTNPKWRVPGATAKPVRIEG